MNPTPPNESRVAALIAAYADRAPIDVDPIAITRLAAARGSSATALVFGRWRGGFGIAIVVLLLALFSALVGASLIAGGQLFRNDSSSAEPIDHVSTIASYAKTHEGYVFVYEDGRVILFPEAAASLSSGVPAGLNYERRLTQRGIELVLSGTVPASAFLLDPQLPSAAWADAEFRPDEPSRWAICVMSDGVLQDARRAIGLLPSSAQSILRGKEQVNRALRPLGPGCSEVTRDDAGRLAERLGEAGFVPNRNRPASDFLGAGSWGGDMSEADEVDVPSEKRVLDVWFLPVFPHDAWVLWGG